MMGYTTKLSDELLEQAETASPDNPVDDPDEQATKTEKKAPPKDTKAK